MSTAPAEQPTAQRAATCPRCGGTDIKTWTVANYLPRAVCRNQRCRHKWTLFTAKLAAGSKRPHD